MKTIFAFSLCCASFAALTRDRRRTRAREAEGPRDSACEAPPRVEHDAAMRAAVASSAEIPEWVRQIWTSP
jgi:hypothetical protein